jgi:hypothetical protein
MLLQGERMHSRLLLAGSCCSPETAVQEGRGCCCCSLVGGEDWCSSHGVDAADTPYDATAAVAAAGGGLWGWGGGCYWWMNAGEVSADTHSR